MGDKGLVKKIAAHYALTPDGVVKNPLVTLDDEGCILSVGTVSPEQLDGYAGVEFHAGMLTPALVNAHCHLELSYLRGAIPEMCGHGGFAAAMAATRNSFTPEQRRQAIAAADREMYDEAITAVGDIANDDSAFDVKSRSAIRYRTFGEVFGLKADNYHRMLSIPHPQLLTPHSLYSLNDSLLKKLCREGQGPLSIHFMESPAERQLFEGRGSLREWFDREGFECDFLHYHSPAQRLTACVPPDRSVMLVHCTCVTQQDIDVIMNHFRAPVHWCLCPRSNAYISGLQPDVELLRRNRLDICIGTDSLASNRSLSVLEELKMIQGVPADELLQWATANGAAALGLHDGTGRLEAGSRCSLAVVSGLDWQSMRMTAQTRIRRVETQIG